MPRRTQTVAGFNVALPKGVQRITAGSKYEQAIQDMMGRQANLRQTTSPKCVVVFFKAKSANPVAVQRCEGRKLEAHNRRQCRGAKNKFVRCPVGGRRRAVKRGRKGAKGRKR